MASALSQIASMDRYKDRVALVTGASSGIGHGICKALVQQGMIVVGCAKNVDPIEALSKELKESGHEAKLIPYTCDLSKEDQILGMFEFIKSKYPKLCVCVNNAGFARDAPLMSANTEEWEDMLDVNIMALCICTRESLKLMSTIDDGAVIQVGCIMGHKVPEIPKEEGNPEPVPNFGFHYGTKFMVRGLTESLRHELKRNKINVRVALISPGAVKTEMYARGFNKKAADKFYSQTPCLQSEDVAQAVVYILRQPLHVNVQDMIVQPRAYQI